MKKLLFTLTLILTLAFFIKCEKDNSIDDTIILEQMTTDVILSVNNAVTVADNASNLKGETTLQRTCPIIRFHHPDTALFPRTIVINYGTSCIDSLGNIKSGKIITVVSAPRNKVETKIFTRFDNYFFNGVKFEGKKLMVVKKVTDGEITLLVNFRLKLTFPDGRVVQRSGERIKIVKR